MIGHVYVEIVKPVPTCKSEYRSQMDEYIGVLNRLVVPWAPPVLIAPFYKKGATV